MDETKRFIEVEMLKEGDKAIINDRVVMVKNVTDLGQKVISYPFPRRIHNFRVEYCPMRQDGSWHSGPFYKRNLKEEDLVLLIGADF